MNKITYHTPGFCRGDDHQPDACEFETLTDLMNLERVKKWAKNPEFSYFALSDNIFMFIGNDGFKWWVIGYIEHPENIDLPKWNRGKHLVELNGEIYILTDEVRSVCGDQIELRDGRVGRNLEPKFGIKLKSC